MRTGLPKTANEGLGKTFRIDIQILRGISVLGVLVFHINSFRFPNGYLGVDAFFVISGFVVMPLIARIYISDGETNLNIKTKLKEFYKRRIFRLAPALASTLIFSVVIILIFGNITDHERFLRQGVATILGLGNLGAYFYSGDTYFNPDPNPLVHTWSLATEEQIYILIPLLLLALAAVRNLNKTFIFKSIFTLTIFSFTLDVFLSRTNVLQDLLQIQNSTSFIFYSLISRVWQFGVGAILYFFVNSKKTIVINKVLKMAALMALLFSIFSPIQTILNAGGIVCILTAVTIYGETINGGHSWFSSTLSWIGDRSYSIYLVHLPLVYLIFNSSLGGSIDNNILKSVSAVILGIAMGAIQYSLVENRFRNQLRTLNFRNFLATVLIVPLIFLGIGFGLQRSDFLGITETAMNAFSQPDSHIALEKGCIDKAFEPKKCLWNSNGNKGTIALFGDSQAYAVADGVVLAGSAAGYKVVVSSRSGCPYLSLDTTDEKPLNCATWQAQSRDWVKANRPTWLVIANWSAGYTNPGDWRTVIDAKGKVASQPSEALNMWKQGLISVIEEAQSVGTKVLVVSNIPFVESFTREVSVFSIFFDSTTSSSFSKEQALNKRANVFEFEKTLADAASGLYIIDPVETLCPGLECKFFLNKKAIYSDSFHITREGSLLLAPEFLKLFL